MTHAVLGFLVIALVPLCMLLVLQGLLVLCGPAMRAWRSLRHAITWRAAKRTIILHRWERGDD